MASHEDHAATTGGMDAAYHAHDVLDETSKTAVVGLGAGFFMAAVQNALSRRNVGAFGVFTRGAPVIGLAAAAPAAYTFVSRTTMNLREKDDALAAGLGGFAAGAVIGLPSKRMPIVFALGGLVGGVQTAFRLAGGRLDSFKEEEDEFARKETARRTTRVPVEQTVSEVGEGRGIKPPGYEERRRERIQEKYGFEINPVKATVEGSQ
ncbi:Mitochondrial import inner membrane translocase subunit Tim17 family protein [Cordyceps fumosorosea ARSEF 2679]|uniref:Mitochondrial import inner membrane translocase subunit Tim17 family protein n=1 Tax=Cordyceps fumosorosea (strain ARSEF 2679) TaxID=1081104 RepID=A0A168EBZ6_CORFA|nr:Mitochondrial import inner membrane translocase subunit Tim17 family protein [Cordyceps fumosorosea ARSEF 2679]OAA73628.1 Mitochondrial import inner membrane translocase subunit Tim17 family protein [Cordyceps fumosorosea ARSEF 2679]